MKNICLECNKPIPKLSQSMERLFEENIKDSLVWGSEHGFTTQSKYSLREYIISLNHQICNHCYYVV